MRSTSRSKGGGGACTELLAGAERVAPGGFIYIETAVGDPAPKVPSNWRLHREKVAGGVAYRLFEKEG